MSNRSLAKSWFLLAVVSLLISGILSLAITGAKMPGVKDTIVDLEFIRWCLVIHINLATLVWFTAIPLGLITYATESRGLFRSVSWFGFFASVAGLLVCFSVGPESGPPVLSNYIPVLNNERYFVGLALYGFGALINFLVPRFSTNADQGRAAAHPGLNESRFGLLVGSVFFALSAFLAVKALLDTSKLEFVTEKMFFEIVVWGSGHLIQHGSSAFLVCGWMILLSSIRKTPILTRAEVFPVFFLLSLPILILPVFFYIDPAGNSYRDGFTQLMTWGIAPGVFLFLYQVVRKRAFRFSDIWTYEGSAFFFSAALILVGFIFGASIEGADMRVPGHYHASIGSVTLAFMAIGYKMLTTVRSRLSVASAWTYGVGQTFFAGGMFIAGLSGMPRRTYGSEHSFTHWGQTLGIGTMAVGGTIALIGGLFFALAILPSLNISSLCKGKIK